MTSGQSPDDTAIISFVQVKQSEGWEIFIALYQEATMITAF